MRSKIWEATLIAAWAHYDQMSHSSNDRNGNVFNFHGEKNAAVRHAPNILPARACFALEVTPSLPVLCYLNQRISGEERPSYVN